MLPDYIIMALMPILMAYALVGETFHEVAGILVFLLYAAQQILHAKWYRRLLRGRYTPFRIVSTIVKLLLLVFMLLLPLSGIALSDHLFAQFPLKIPVTVARPMHLAISYWTYVLMSFRTGLFSTRLIRNVQQYFRREHGRSVYTSVITKSLGILVGLYGAFSFFSRRFPGYLFLRSQFVFYDSSEPLLFFLIDFAAIFFFFAVLGYFTASALRR